MSDAATHFSTEALGEPEGPGRYVTIDEITPAEFAPGLTFRPVLGQREMANFVNYAPGAEAPRHVHEEEQMVIVIDRGAPLRPRRRRAHDDPGRRGRHPAL